MKNVTILNGDLSTGSVNKAGIAPWIQRLG